MPSALKYAISILAIVLSSFLFSGTAFATAAPQTPCTPTAGDGQVQPCDYHFQQNSDTVFIGLEHSISCGASGVDYTVKNPPKCEAPNPDNGTQLWVYNEVPNGGALGGIGRTMVALYSNPPITTTEYLASVGSNLGITPAYADVTGSGSGVLGPVLALWQVTRNITYAAFIIVFIVIGFMIMIRAKINAQTVVSIQNAVPGLIIGLILVTFSYLISAFIVDMAFVGSSLVGYIFQQAAHNGGLQTIAYDPNDSVFNYLWKTILQGGTPFNVIVGPLQQAILSVIHVPGVGGFAGYILGSILGGVAALIVIIALVVQTFRLLFELVKAYVTILVTTVTAPFVILGASFPGRGGALGGWWRTLLGNALIFPVVIAVFLFGGMFLSGYSQPKNALPLFGSLDANLLRVVIGYGIILSTPGIPKMVKEALKATDNPIGQVAQQGFQAGSGAFGGAVRSGYERTGINRLAEAQRKENIRDTQKKIKPYVSSGWKKKAVTILPS